MYYIKKKYEHQNYSKIIIKVDFMENRKLNMILKLHFVTWLNFN